MRGRPQAELKPAAFSFRRVGFGWLGLHGRIIRDRGEPEQGNLGSRPTMTESMQSYESPSAIPRSAIPRLAVVISMIPK